METIYNAANTAANTASKVLFGESKPAQDNRNPNATTTDNTDRPHETNPFRQSTETDNNPFHHTADTASSKPHTGADSGFGSQHTAGSVFEINKPAAKSYDNPSSSDFAKPSTADTYGQHSSNYDSNPASHIDKPFTTTSTHEKHSIGDLNKDGSRHETSDVEKPIASAFGHTSNPTISSIHDSSSGNPFGSSDHASAGKPSATRHDEHSHTKDTPTTHSTHTDHHSTHHSTHTDHHPTQEVKSLITPNISSSDPPHHSSTSHTPHPSTSVASPNPNPSSSLTGATGSGPHSAVEPSVSAHPIHAQQQTPKHQGADRPLQDPHHTHKTSESEGTGEKYEKSTGLAAEGGDFDARRPGAGREADRLLDEKGMHHGADLKPDTTALGGGSKLGHGHAHEHSKPHSQEKTSVESEHKSLGEKIKEKLHLGHH